MRVLLVVGHAAGGIGRHVDDLAVHLRADGHAVTIVAPRVTAERFGWADAHVAWPLRGGREALTAPSDWRRLVRLARGADVVHAHGHQAGVVAASAVSAASVAPSGARARPRLVVSLHNDLPPARPGVTGAVAARLGRAVVATALRRADLVTGASADLVELARSLGARRVEQADVPSARTPDLLAAEPATHDERTALLAAAGVPADAPLVLAVARLAPQKRLDVLVEAARASGWRASWVVVGDGDPGVRASLEAAASSLAGPATVHLLGARADVGAWLRSADLLVVTSRWEARALVVQEAMAAAVPPVVTRTGGLPALVGDAGTVVRVGDPAALAAVVDALLDDPLERARLGRAARSAAASWPTPAAEARRWVERYVALTSR